MLNKCGWTTGINKYWKWVIGGTLVIRLCASYRKKPWDWSYLDLLAGWSPLLPLRLYFCCLKANIFLARRTAGGSCARERHVHFAFPLLLAGCLLERWEVGMTCFCVITTTLVFPKALCRFQSLGALRWEPPNLPSDLDPPSTIELLGPYWRRPHCPAQNWGCLPSRNSASPPLIIHQVKREDRGTGDFLGHTVGKPNAVFPRVWSSQHQ